jgi:hypothetical protein
LTSRPTKLPPLLGTSASGTETSSIHHPDADPKPNILINKSPPLGGLFCGLRIALCRRGRIETTLPFHLKVGAKLSQPLEPGDSTLIIFVIMIKFCCITFYN